MERLVKLCAVVIIEIVCDRALTISTMAFVVRTALEDLEDPRASRR